MPDRDVREVIHDSETCAMSERADRHHSWSLLGGEPYIVCHFCGELRDVLTGRTIRKGTR